MKKIIPALKGALLIAIISFNNANGQDIASGTGKFMDPTKSLPIVNSGKTTAPFSASNVSQRAIKDFAKTFKNNVNPVWSNAADGGSTASFAEAGIQNCFYYDKKGHWVCNIKRYSEANLSKEIRKIIMPVYYDYKINGISEIILPDKTVHLLYLQDAHNFKTIRVADGAMDVIEWFKDGKVVDL